MVQTQMDTGYADRVPLVLGQLKDAVSSGRLAVSPSHHVHHPHASRIVMLHTSSLQSLSVAHHSISSWCACGLEGGRAAAGPGDQLRAAASCHSGDPNRAERRRRRDVDDRNCWPGGRSLLWAGPVGRRVLRLRAPPMSFTSTQGGVPW